MAYRSIAYRADEFIDKSREQRVPEKETGTRCDSIMQF
ncbi:hypothetical protein JCM19239_5225 [Vibrio variabilis]|uniref:Uncharacterized protein n=1 Tax=Vibrio variabilis TaxID=990271 RepID=A0ABQ0JD96_9VIBR|nr:hypothetical protein JCM19239_5225 [Vibrio variabilis]